MIQFELHIEHIYKDKSLGAYKINGNQALTVIGSNKNANIQLIGEDVEGIHATIELDKNIWTINDVSGESGVWIKKDPILNFSIKSTTVVNICGHTLKLTPHYFENKLFAESNNTTERTKNQKVFHQIVVKKFGFVIESQLIKTKKSFFYKIGNEKFEFKAPTEHEWKVNDFKNVSIHQRLVYSNEIKETAKDKIFALIDPSLKIPMGVAFLVMFIIFSLVYFVPQQPELNEITKNPSIKKNKFTKIIYKAKTKKEKKKIAKAKKILLKGKANKKTPAPAPLTVAKPAKKIAGKGGGSRTFTKSSKKRISQLLGKITKRASQNAIAIETAGVAATTKKTLGPGLSSGTRIANIAPTGGGNGGKSKGISGVKTGGKAGGKGSYRGLSGFSTGSIGGSNVGIIEEETEIAGGLTKEQISRVIKRNLGQIRYCYERQLSSNPDLYGKILVDFSIGANGKINKNKIKRTTLGNSMVEGCILRKMAKWKFPKPVGGTTVKVTYPFLFKSTN